MTSRLEAWSWSRYECWELCPYKFKLKFLDKHQCFVTEKSPAMERGNLVHLDLANYVRTPMNEAASMPEAVVLPFQKKLVNDIRSHDDKLVEQQWGFGHRWQQTGWFGKDVWYRAITDVTMLYEDMVVEVIDWKTGKHYDDNAEQMELFALTAMCKFLPAIHVITRLVYVDAQDETIEEYPAHDADALKRKWEGKVAPMFADTTYLPRPNAKCRFCEAARSKGGPCRFG